MYYKDANGHPFKMPNRIGAYSGVLADIPKQITALLQAQGSAENGKAISKLHYDLLIWKKKIVLWICLQALTSAWKDSIKQVNPSVTWGKHCVKWWAKPLFKVLWK